MWLSWLTACAQPQRFDNPPVSSSTFPTESRVAPLSAWADRDRPVLWADPLVLGKTAVIRLWPVPLGADVALSWALWDPGATCHPEPCLPAPLDHALWTGEAADAVIEVTWPIPATGPEDAWVVFSALIDGDAVDVVARRIVAAWPPTGPAAIEPLTTPGESVPNATVLDLWRGIDRSLVYNALGNDRVLLVLHGGAPLQVHAPPQASIQPMAGFAPDGSVISGAEITVDRATELIVQLPAEANAAAFGWSASVTVSESAAQWAHDSDGDGVPASVAHVSAYRGPVGSWPVGDDCDDTRADVFPAAFDGCDDGVDQDCTGDDRPCHPTLDGGFVAEDAFAAWLHLPDVYETRTTFGPVGDVDGDGVKDLGVADGTHVAVFSSLIDGASLLDAVVTVSSATDHLAVPPDPTGDLNRDGLPDMVLVDPSWEGAGAVFILHGPQPALSSVADASTLLVGDVANGDLGRSAAAGTDVTGDGSPDLVVLAPHGVDNGFVAVFERVLPGDLVLSDAVAMVEGEPGLGRPNSRVDTRSDANGDGLFDLVISGSTNGRAWVVYGPIPVFTTVNDADATVDARAEGVPDLIGTTAGDADGDGRADILFAALHTAVGEPSLFGVLPNATVGAFALTDLVHRVSGPTDSVTASFDHAGDLDSDGSGDLAIGNPTDPLGGTGRVRIFLGPLTGYRNADEADVWIDGHSVGQALVGIQDHDGDGVDDLAVLGMNGLGLLLGS